MNIGIFGYGNLGKGVELAVSKQKDMNLIGIFTRRNPDKIKTLKGTKVYPASEIINFKNLIDVVIICGGSATDLPVLTPQLVNNFNVVDSFDTHARILEHYNNVNDAAQRTCHTAVISIGWDPGLFSLQRIINNSVLHENSYTFWGKGISQGHSDAIRRIDGVIDARQYTIPKDYAIQSVLNGYNPELTTRDKHYRVCYVVADINADKDSIKNKIINMPNYFDEYDTEVNFVSMEELKKYHNELPHGGKVIAKSKSGLNNEHNETIEYSLSLDSNPEFTAMVLVAYARAVFKLFNENNYGCKTIYDIPLKYISDMEYNELLSNLL